MRYSLLVWGLLIVDVCSIAISYQQDATKVSTEAYDGAQRVVSLFFMESNHIFNRQTWFF